MRQHARELGLTRKQLESMLEKVSLTRTDGSGTTHASTRQHPRRDGLRTKLLTPRKAAAAQHALDRRADFFYTSLYTECRTPTRYRTTGALLDPVRTLCQTTRETAHPLRFQRVMFV